jgi:membrane-bound ClpP family serine protease
MIVLGIALLIIGFLTGIGILWILGIIAVVLGLFMLAMGSLHGPVAGRRYWY